MGSKQKGEGGPEQTLRGFSVLLSFAALTQNIEGGDAIRFGERGEAENGIDEAIDRRTVLQAICPKVDQFGGMFTDNLHTEEAFARRIGDEFQQALTAPVICPFGDFRKRSTATRRSAVANRLFLISPMEAISGWYRSRWEPG